MFRVEAPELLMEAGLKLAAMPAGNPVAVKETVPPNPLTDATFTLKLVPWPTAMVCVLGVVESEKSAVVEVVVTARLKVAVWATVPLMPVTATVYVPAATPLEAEIEIVGSPDPVIVLELRLAVTPEGTPNRLSCTVPVKLPCAATLAETVVLPPLATVAELGLTATEKLAGGAMVNFCDVLNPAQPVRHSSKETASNLATNLGEFIWAHAS